MTKVGMLIRCAALAAAMVVSACAADGEDGTEADLSLAPGDVVESATTIGTSIPVECPGYANAASLSSTSSNAYYLDPMGDGTQCTLNGVYCRPCNRGDDINTTTGVADTQCRSRIVWQSLGWRCVKP